ncbi:MAG: DUF2171 domain-containing protein [Sphingomonas sp.]
MGYERYPRNTDPEGDYYNRGTAQDYGRDYGSGADYSYSSAREFAAAGELGDRGRGRGYGRRSGYGARGFGERSYGERDYGDRFSGDRGYYGGRPTYGDDRPYRGSYASEGHRFTDYGRGDREDDRERMRRRAQRGYGRPPQGYDYGERDFWSRAGDEVRSWFGDEEAERRREYDQRYDEREGGRWDSPRGQDSDYHQWRRRQIDALDRDYAEYRNENRDQFHSEFGRWRQERQGQRASLQRVEEHMDVVGSDGGHVGTVDKVRGDRIILTKSDRDAGGHHHSIPSRWIETVSDKVTIRKTADEAHAHWRDEERNQAMFGAGEEVDYEVGAGSAGTRNLDKSFSGTY